MTTSTPPRAIPGGVLNVITPQSQRLVMSRRGSTVWRVETEDPETEKTDAYAVKVGFPSETHAHTALAPSREAYILRTIRTNVIHDGEWAEGTWSVQPWHSGPSLYSKWGPHRAPGSSAVPNFMDALSCAAALSDLHRAGWVHGDVQPAHLIMSESGATLIDLALARGRTVPEGVDFPYRGCLVHYEAPEISRSVLESGTAVPTCESDVYALGASLMISATGWRHVAYPDEAPREVQRQAIADGPHRPVTIPGELGKLVNAMLMPSPADRPTAAEVCDALCLAL
ncbi:protein kinase domain-containing protein [Streptomyces sp. NBC_01439]|uniref:protein kinase domain-containing protein n=1 Tax=Streptomyces sp. NBC_01439 TaxID=2903867 RepID=UPI00069C7C6F|nr:protein kinase [Streptomyces sp. NBC_01439]